MTTVPDAGQFRWKVVSESAETTAVAQAVMVEYELLLNDATQEPTKEYLESPPPTSLGLRAVPATLM